MVKSIIVGYIIIVQHISGNYLHSFDIYFGIYFIAPFLLTLFICHFNGFNCAIQTLTRRVLIELGSNVVL